MAPRNIGAVTVQSRFARLSLGLANIDNVKSRLVDLRADDQPENDAAREDTKVMG